MKTNTMKTNTMKTNTMKTNTNDFAKKIGLATAAATAGIASTHGQTVQITLTGNQINSDSGNALNADLTGDQIDDVAFNLNISKKEGGGWSYFPDNYDIGFIKGQISMVHSARLSSVTNYNATNQTTQTEQIIATFKNQIVLEMEGSVSVPGEFHHLVLFGDDYGFVSTADIKLGSNYQFPDNPSLTVLAPIAFSDARINNGEYTNGFVEMAFFATTTSTSPVAKDATFRLNRLIFDESDTARPNSVAVTDPAYTEWTPVPEPSGLTLLALGAGGIVARRRRKDLV